MMMRALVLIAVLGCGKSGPAASSGSATTGSATASGADARAAAPAAKLLFDDKEQTAELRIAFDNHVPILPALSADGEWIARYDSDETGPMFPHPIYISITRLDGAGKPERLELVDMKMATSGPEQTSWDDKPPPPQIAKQARDNGKAAVARLHDFGSLVEVKLDTDKGDPKPVKIGDFTLASVTKSDQSDAETLNVTLADANGKVLHHDRIKSYNTDESPASFAGGHCYYGPRFGNAYTDQAKQTLYAFVRFHYNEECSPQDPLLIEWPLSATRSDTETLEDVLTGQFGDAPVDAMFTADAQVVVAGAVATRDHLPFRAKAHDDDNVDVTLARDRKTAWGSATTSNASDPWRASSVFVKTPAGWRIAATMWSRPMPNAKANKDAKAGKLASSPPFTGDAGDAGLRAAFAKLVSDGVDADAVARTGLVAIGSADGERTVGGKTFATGWNAAWKGHATIISSIARVAPSGTTGWVAANVELAKTGYKIPFNLMAVFDKTPAGSWSLVHIHFAI